MTSFAQRSLAKTLKDAACQIFLSTLDKIDGVKDLVLSKSILVQLDSICGMTKLRQNAVDKVFKLLPEQPAVVSDTTNRVYVVRPLVSEIQLVVDQVNKYLNQEDDRIGAPVDVRFWIIFVPRAVHFCQLILEEEGIHEFVSVLECPLGLIPLEYDVYSLEDSTIFRTLFLDKDTTPLNDIANSIAQLQFLSGKIVDIHGQGKFAKNIADKLDQINLTLDTKEQGTRGSANEVSKSFNGLNFHDELRDDKESAPFTDIYLMDRNCDYASTLISQLNYEGILDEVYGICCNKLEIAISLPNSEENQFVKGSTKHNTDTNAKQAPKKIIKHSLSKENDPIYGDIRDNHFSTVFSLIKSRNNEMKEKYNRSQDMNLSNLKNFVAHELKGLQAELKSLDVHISACEELMKERNKYDFSDQLRIEQNIIEGVDIRKCLDYVTKLIVHRLNPHVPLRLLALLSLTQGGLAPRDYNNYHSTYCENYGIPNNVTFNNLERLGLITKVNLSLNSLTSGLLSYNSADSSQNLKPQVSSSLLLSSFTGKMSSFTERASGKVAAVVSSSVLPRRGNLSAMLKKFQLVPEINGACYCVRDPKDPAFVFGGAYIPLICQLIDNCVLPPPPRTKANPGPNLSPTELMKLLPGPNFKQRIILVYFIGGVTYAEITALRFLAKQRGVKIAVAATSIINGNKLIDSLRPEQA